MKTMPNKTDRNDARALAQIMRTGWYRQVHVKSRQCRLWRSLLVARRTVLNEMRSIENVDEAWRARVAVARKLAVILHRMWSDETEFRLGRNPAAALAAA